MKNRILLLLTLVLFLPTLVNAKDKVKVYLFEAGGCPYCVKEEEYLKGLDGYDKTFTIVKKELYVDHVDWAEGKDYALGKKVAKAFNSFGFEDATHEATPFVVISDLYAASAYNTSLESVINEAYENGDKDIVKCYENGKDNCLDHLKKDTSSSSKNYTPVIIITGLVILITYLGIYLFSYLFKIGANAYLPTDGKSGFKGLFSSINEFSAIIVCLLPIAVNYLRSKKNYIVLIIILKQDIKKEYINFIFLIS